MKKITIKLEKDQYLSDVEPFKSTGFPTNSILHKVIPGCGATSVEMRYTEHNSIIIVPNVPVIEDKVVKHNKKYSREKHILGVYEKVDVGQIEDYLNSEATYKKIVTTPEGFMTKVLKAFENDIDKMLKDYFLLFDECERIITDVSYRGQIAAPVDWFLRFDNKAMVSATTLPFSHKGFEGFNHYVIEPQYDYSKKIQVINTNNVIESIEDRLEELESDKLFLFINSTETIYDVVDTLGIKAESKAFCAEKSVLKLSTKKFRNAYDLLDLSELAKYNFLTSRYFSAFDIALDYKPDVILVTDVYSAKHSVLDPHTEIIQIAGRFRNGVNSLTHITNFNSEIESKSKDETLHYLQGCFDTYEGIIKLLNNTSHPGSKDTLQFFIEQSPVAKYYTEDKLNEFMIDNYVHQQRVQGYYQNFDNLKNAYAQVDSHFKPKYKSVEYLLGDKDRLNRQSKTSIREQQWETLRQIDSYSYKPGIFTIKIGNSDRLLSTLRSFYPWLTEAYDLLGIEGLKRAGLTAAKVNPAKAKAREIKELKRLAPYVYEEFCANDEYLDSKIKSAIPELCAKANVSLKPTISLVLKFFKGRRSSKNGVHTHVLNDKIDLETLTPFD